MPFKVSVFTVCTLVLIAVDTTPNPLAYKDEIAQSTCTAILPGKPSHVYAVRRTCSASTATCTAICANLTKKCFNALHVYTAASLSNTDTGKLGLHTYRYNNCDLGGCGPNFCCCSG
ncbi:uncharacterized protein LOC132749789 [Ruditapes philippinarum]|uniref:uncharacterized protein LOC132749789 n=1 Tax=Ruditapes philippinarum TaxID=129788 RepID=UPI00295AD7C2|nr:uncharacterized protein LOC132749789 [Ruditapes philippinarum]